MVQEKQRFAVIGQGHFGAPAARGLYEAGKEVIVIDIDPEVVKQAAAYSSEALVLDATDRAALEAAGIGDVDAAIVSLGDRMDLTTLVTLHLKEMAVPHIAVKVISDEYARIMKAVGAHEVIHPEVESAARLAHRLSRSYLVDFLPLLEGLSIVEVEAPEAFVGKTLRELALRQRMNVQVIAMQSITPDRQKTVSIPGPDVAIQPGDRLFILGEDKDLDRLREIVVPKGELQASRWRSRKS